MRILALPLLCLTLLYAGFFASLAWAAGKLPPVVASHFNAAGQPDGFLDRSAHLLAMAGLGVGLPLGMVGIFFVSRWLPTSVINLPRRDFWLAPERRGATHAYLDRQALWFGCLCVLFVAGLNYLVVQANLQQPAQFPPAGLLVLVGGFIAGTLVWVARLLWHFGRSTGED